MVVRALKEHNSVAWIHFWNLFYWSVHCGEKQLVLFYETWFYLCGEVNFHNNRYWTAESPSLIQELPFHDEWILNEWMWVGWAPEATLALWPLFDVLCIPSILSPLIVPYLLLNAVFYIVKSCNSCLIVWSVYPGNKILNYLGPHSSIGWLYEAAFILFWHVLQEGLFVMSSLKEVFISVTVSC
jgi:hypothetical protein